MIEIEIYLLYILNNIKHIFINKYNLSMYYGIFIKEMKMNIPECMDENNVIFNYVTGSKIIITILKLKILLNKEKSNSQKIKEDNSLGMNKFWEEKYNLKIEKILKVLKV